MSIALSLIILAFWALWDIYRLFYKPIKKYKHFLERASRFERLRMYDRAIKTRQQALELERLSNRDRANVMLGIGGTYLNMKCFAEAAAWFEKSFELVRGVEIAYNKQYRKVIEAFIHCGRTEDAERILDDLIERRRDDKRFQRFEQLKQELLPK